MSQLANTLIRRLQTTQQIIEISRLEIRSFIEDRSGLVDLSFFDLDLSPAEELANQQQDLQGGIGQLEDDVGEDVLVAEVD